MSLPLTVLLIQARASRDPMLEHERKCVERRISGRPVTLVVNNAVATTADPSWLEGVDAVIFGGSGDYSVYHPFSEPWVTPLRRVLDAALERQLPGFGICFGHQLLGFHLGGRVVTYPEREEVGTVHVKLTEAGRSCDVFSRSRDDFQAHTGHTDHLVETPSGVELLARGEVVETQAFRVKGTRFYSTQFHPDLTGAEARERYLSNKTDERGGVEELHRMRAAAFVKDADDATTLLGRFIDLIMKE